jgi:hypothetical protein
VTPWALTSSMPADRSRRATFSRADSPDRISADRISADHAPLPAVPPAAFTGTQHAFT